jgi:hypothetical protein
MAIFYDGISGLVFSCAVSMALITCGVILHNRSKAVISTRSCSLMLAISILGFIAAQILFATIGYKLQMAIIEPSIQQALDQACGPHVVLASEGALDTGSGVEWLSQSATCYPQDKDWICSCHPIPAP